MKHPPYHLRPNKAVDRFMLVEILRRLSFSYDLRKYRYIGFGGPFLEDHHLIHEYFPDMGLVSIEENNDTFKRQKFHKFTKKLELNDVDFKSFLSEFTSTGREVFWLDYTSLRPEWFNDFGTVLNAAGDGTIVKITLCAEWRRNPCHIKIQLSPEEFEKKLSRYKGRFETEFAQFLPREMVDSDFKEAEFQKYLQLMIQVFAQETLPSNSGRTFQVLSTTAYSDGKPMLSVTGIVCENSTACKRRKCLRGWSFSNLKWDVPKRIQLPVLSIKERQMLEQKLPVKKNTGKALANCLGYQIDKSEHNLDSLQQYAEFYNYYPHYAKITP